MADPDRITETSGASHAAQSADGQRRNWRPLLWVVLVISLVCNAVTSLLSIPVFIGIAFGLVVLASGATLAVDYYRRKRR